MAHLYQQYGTEEEIIARLMTYKQEPDAVTVSRTDVVTLSPHFFRDELKTGIGILNFDNPWHGIVNAFDTLLFYPLLELLQTYEQENHRGACEAAREMTRVLEPMYCSDDDTFPDYQISLLEGIVHT